MIAIIYLSLQLFQFDIEKLARHVHVEFALVKLSSSLSCAALVWFCHLVVLFLQFLLHFPSFCWSFIKCTSLRL